MVVKTLNLNCLRMEFFFYALILLECTAPDCEWKAQAGNVCVASFDWSCSGICKSVEKIKFVHEKCGEGDGTVWSSLF